MTKLTDQKIEIDCPNDPDPGTAAWAFDCAYGKVVHRIGSLQTMISKSRIRFEADGATNYGFVGDLGRIAGLLDQALGDES